MDALPWILLAALVIGAPGYYFWKQQRDAEARRLKQRVTEARDTVADWPPTATRVLNATERQAYDVLRRALPDHLVLAQVPLSRFIRVPTRYSYGEWLGRVGQLSADLVVCDASSQVLAVVEVRGNEESPRSLQRHQRMTRVLKAADIRVLVWAEDELPTPEAARSALLPEEAARLAKQAAARTAPATAAAPPAPAAPIAPAAVAPRVDDDVPREPPPTTWYSDLDVPPAPAPGASKAPPRS
jgi:hypothetical protein